MEANEQAENRVQPFHVRHCTTSVNMDKRDELVAQSDVPAEVNSLETFAAAHATGRLWVAVDAEDRPVGFALVTEVDGVGHLEEMDVLPAHGRKGLGDALLVCDWAKSNGYLALTISTFRDVWNAPFYAERGFRILSTLDLTPGLANLVESEKRHGLRTNLRIVMRREF